MIIDYLKSGILFDHLEDYIHPNYDYGLFILLRESIYFLKT
jgi:hypothetical protein